MNRNDTPTTGPVQLDAFFAALRGRGPAILMLDYDGTLAPFRVRREEAAPYPGVRESLDRIMRAGRTRLVIVSGRWTQDLLPLLALEATPEIWGSHGWERLMPDGLLRLGPMESRALDGLKRASSGLTETPWADRLESKPGCLAIHWRGMESGERQKLEYLVRHKWSPIARECGLDLAGFDGGLELRVPGRDKGDAVRGVLAEASPGMPAAYMGDDLTDEDAFAAIKGHGTGILVRDEYRPTRAAIWLRPPGQLLDFLERWHTTLMEK